ncbi:unnamed protein product [Effrenium voratum]|nr:unnamed protein product [Effrenium voratum]
MAEGATASRDGRAELRAFLGRKLQQAWPSVAPAPAPAAARWLDAALEALEALASEELGDGASERELRQRIRVVGMLLAEELEEQPAWAREAAASAAPSASFYAGLQELRRLQRQRKEAFAAQEAIHSALRARQRLELSEAELEAYRKSAPVVGGKAWSRSTVDWVLQELETVRCVTPGHLGDFRLLDVGSSYGAFHHLNAVAVDLAPAAEGVLRGDFLQVEIQDAAAAPFVVERGELRALRAESFDGAVLSLVLSFLPTPPLRREMLDRCWRVLRADPAGSLFVVEKSSLEDQRRKDFQAALEAAGFRSLRYAAVGRLQGETRPHAHAWHLQKTAIPGALGASALLPVFKEFS